ncbi:ANTAR domain protein with unknown sensor [Beutenbergia cavernae DSM 12333]|uniref:ANTAR domain-containing protein n=1 Tax=Beutenbergia cavernae (strain ATCC BAA-8 / DSM 12333 / CCUG 43141 / JCM 11478 / NBRC 16432 / NCIMB 13614 / HKI 0122) TaxID=471853 RepID=C5C412_BEUC1|nr:GAF and ANTAR domain-containing protein [Beutenbergia cavernae]ACQ79925.1 ANTAR domain protein with unknown sensor [Beutenbergia cavernae DSM 12333]
MIDDELVQNGSAAEPPLTDQLADAVRLLAAEPTLQQTLDRITDLARTMIDGCHAAGVSLVRSGRIETPSATHPLVRAGDELQYSIGEGPCLDAIRDEEIVRSADLVDDLRWPRWSDRVVRDLGVRSMLAVQLYTSDAAHGALNMYSREPGAFRDDVVPLATTFGAVAAAALEAARTEEQLQSAVQTRTVIGQAQGIVMERYGVSDAQAFAVLSRVSQSSNTRLADIARDVVRTRRIPGVADAAQS